PPKIGFTARNPASTRASPYASCKCETPASSWAHLQRGTHEMNGVPMARSFRLAIDWRHFPEVCLKASILQQSCCSDTRLITKRDVSLKRNSHLVRSVTCVCFHNGQRIRCRKSCRYWTQGRGAALLLPSQRIPQRAFCRHRATCSSDLRAPTDR